MKLTIITMIAAVVAAAQGGGGGQAKGGGGGQQAQAIQQIKPGLFVVTGAGGNTGVRVTPDGLIVVDTKNLGDQFYNGLVEQIKTVSTAPVKYVIVTHHHQDHSGNIGKFEEAGAKVIVQENLNKNLETYAPAQGKPAKANVTYANDYTVKLGGIEVKVYHFAPAHTSGDSIVYYPDLKVVQTGDVVVGTAPNVDFPFGGSAVTWVKALDSISKLDFDTVIPGHSAPGQTTMTRADFLAYKTKWETLVSRAKDLVKQGTPKDELLAKIKTDDIGWNINNQQWQNQQRLDAFYAELQSAK
jgi:cyclase